MNTTTTLLFPGQGSQYISQGLDFYNRYTEAKEVFQEADSVLNQNLSKLIFYGSESDLKLTSNAQPAILATSIAILRVIQKQMNINESTKSFFDIVAGHSLGEYTALVANNAFSFETAIKLVRKRGDAMQKAAPISFGSMAALIGGRIDDIEKLIYTVISYNKNYICEIANDNEPGQVVISGSSEAIDYAISIAKEYGIKKAIKLQVSAPFHSSMMKSAADIMKRELSHIDINDFSIPIVPNVTADILLDKELILDLLVAQVTNKVRWRESIDYIYNSQKVRRFIEIGPSKILSNIAKRMFQNKTEGNENKEKLQILNVEKIDDIDYVLSIIET